PGVLQVVVQNLVKNRLPRQRLRIVVERLEARGGQPDALNSKTGSGAHPVLCVECGDECNGEKKGKEKGQSLFTVHRASAGGCVVAGWTEIGSMVAICLVLDVSGRIGKPILS